MVYFDIILIPQIQGNTIQRQNDGKNEKI